MHSIDVFLQDRQLIQQALAGLSEEAPQVYKDVDRVIQCVVNADLARKVARLKPIAVIKG